MLTEANKSESYDSYMETITYKNKSEVLVINNHVETSQCRNSGVQVVYALLFLNYPDYIAPRATGNA